MKTIKIGTIGALLISTMVLGGNVFAAERGTRDTDAQIIFEDNTDPTNPVDPIDPENPVLPIDPINPGNPITPGSVGPLSLDYASALNFGKQKITSTDQTYFAATQPVTDMDGENERDVPLYAQVTDNRGTLEGWSLTVKQNGQFKTDDADEALLTGAKIEFVNGTISTVSEALMPSMTSTVDVTADGNGAISEVMSAKKGEGAGTYIYRLGDEASMAESVKLSVPGKTVKIKDVAYKTTLTWALNDVPDSGGGEVVEPEPEPEM